MGNRWLGLVALTIGVAMIIVDATIVNVAIPSIIADLGISYTTAEWMNTIYSLVFAALLITIGRLGDLFGRRRLYLAGVIVFVGASMLAGLAPDGAALLVGRLLQGVGGAMILPSTLSTINATFRGKERAVAFGIWGSVIGGMAALGPLLGGWFTTELSWRWAFYINLPFGLLALLGTWRFVQETRDEHSRPGFDWGGTVSLAAGIAALVFALIEGESYGWGSPEIVASFATAGVLLPVFVFIERHRARLGRPVLVDFTLFSIGSFRYGNIAVLIVSLGEFGLIFVIPLFLQFVLGYTAFETGIVLLALAGGAFVAGPSAAQLSRRIGPRLVVQLGMALEAVGILLLGITVSPETTGWALAPYLFIYGLGIGFATAQLTSVILIEVPPRQSGEASGIQSTSRQIGSALGVAILGTTLWTSLGEAGLGASPATFSSAVSTVSYLACGFVTLGLVASLRLPAVPAAQTAT